MQFARQVSCRTRHSHVCLFPFKRADGIWFVNGSLSNSGTILITDTSIASVAGDYTQGANTKLQIEVPIFGNSLCSFFDASTKDWSVWCWSFASFGLCEPLWYIEGCFHDTSDERHEYDPRDS